MSTFRDVIRWGHPEHDEDLNAATRAALKERLGLCDSDFQKPFQPGNEPLSLPASALSAAHRRALEELVGATNIDLRDAARARRSSGQSYLDVLRFRLQTVPKAPDAVVAPRNADEVRALLRFCTAERLPLVPVGGSTSVTRATEFPQGGICLDLTRHLDKVLAVDSVSGTATVQAGIYGPAYEAYLNELGYTCGHFPQSFEHSTVGGWLAARGAGQQSTFYGKIEDIVLGMKVQTPAGEIDCAAHPAASIGPDWKHVFLGSEGCLGVITEATLKIWPLRGRSFFSFFFPSWEKGAELVREVLQGDFGKPGVLRLSDPEETELGLRLNGMAGGTTDTWLQRLGYTPGKRCLLLGSSEGEGLLLATRVHAAALLRGGLPLGPGPGKKWYAKRFHHPYLRAQLMDLGLIVDTLETSASWAVLNDLRTTVRATLEARPQTIAMCHISHAYHSGANLYFIFMSPIDRARQREDYDAFHASIVDSIVRAGGALSHHHGIGRLFAPWYREAIGAPAHELLRALKAQLDPAGVLNPGALGL